MFDRVLKKREEKKKEEKGKVVWCRVGEAEGGDGVGDFK